MTRTHRDKNSQCDNVENEDTIAVWKIIKIRDLTGSEKQEFLKASKHVNTISKASEVKAKEHLETWDSIQGSIIERARTEKLTPLQIKERFIDVIQTLLNTSGESYADVKNTKVIKEYIQLNPKTLLTEALNTLENTPTPSASTIKREVANFKNKNASDPFSSEEKNTF